MSPKGDRRKRRHHFFPVFHLRRFASDNGDLVVFDRHGRLQPNPKELRPKDVGFENDLYTLGKEEGAHSDLIEDWLAEHIDGPAAACLTSLEEGLELNRSQRSAFSRYIMSRDLRTPKTRDFILKVAQDGFDRDWAERLANPSELRAAIIADGGPHFSDEELEYYSTIYKFEVSDAFWLDFVTRHINGGAPRVFNKNWALITAIDGSEFLSTDIGVLKFGPDVNAPPVDPVPGWWTRADSWFMPLSRRCALMMAPGLTMRSATADAGLVDRMNRLLVGQCYSHVFSAFPADWIAATLDLPRPP